ncbi:MAG: protein-disulfide reductase DsbD family protein [Burkholderiales bacterium]
MRKGLAIAIVLSAASVASAAAPELLDAREAFRIAASYPGKSIEVRLHIAEGYYLYRDKVRIEVTPASIGAGKPRLPRGTFKTDEFFGRTEVYRGEVVIRVAVSDRDRTVPAVLKVRTQGCADAGVCYPPREEVLTMVRGDVDRSPEDAATRRRGSLLDQLEEPAASPAR